MKTSNWGRFPEIEGDCIYSRTHEQLESHIAQAPFGIARGMGRCYGDSSLSERMFCSSRMNRFLAFDDEKGVLSCEAGVSFAELLDIFVPKGWFPPVTPGTKYITVGGAIASDIHGKNHHKEGSFSQHLLSFKLLAPDGNHYTCSREENSDFFWATCGGMGLTGYILEASFQLKKIETAYISQTNYIARDLEQAMKTFQDHASATYSVAWLDSLAGGKNLGRSVVMIGEHTLKKDLPNNPTPLTIPQKRKLNIPFDFPNFVLNKFSIKAFNELFFRKNAWGKKHFISDYDSYFYPLDSILNWNRIYGSRGFTQYQLVIPEKYGFDGIQKVIEKIRQRGLGSFLVVLKYFGPQEGLLSFPLQGYTLTLDYPISEKLFPFLDELDEIVAKYEGRLYLTKDARMSHDFFWKTYPNASRFLKIKQQLDPGGKMNSLQARRLGLI